MLVSHTKGFVFLKTRKTAGTSIEMLLEPFCVPPGQDVAEIAPAKRSRYGIVGARGVPGQRTVWRRDWRNHMPAERVRRNLGARRWDRYVKISAVRNPFDRMVSLYHWLTGDPRQSPGCIARFRRWLAAETWPDDARIVQIGGAWVVDRLIRFEHLTADLVSLSRALGLALNPAALPQAKRAAPAAGPDPAAYFDAACTDIVRRRMAWAFEHGGYAEDPRLAGRG
ncbi:MAG: sulfotransferase family 2 domain-containing protein [Pseudomonadota bacterium]